MARLPDGDHAPATGALPASALATLHERSLGFYVHVPYCASRCGYCDFNTYVAGPMERSTWAPAAVREVALARLVLGDDAPPVSTVFFGGGTPTLLDVADLALVLDAIRSSFGLADGAEVTTEANPETVSPASLAALVDAGFTRISLGMQSAAPHVLRTLEREHTPGRAPAAAVEARAAGFAHVSLDLIYGTPGETASDWQATLDAALSGAPDHISTYALTVEPGTKLFADVRRGRVSEPDEDELADRYLVADRVLRGAGFDPYELCSWSLSGADHCRHNLTYWTGQNWWGAGPGAHSHVGGVRWWNVLHPERWAARLAADESPAAAREDTDDEARRLERIMLETRMAAGIPLSILTPDGLSEASRLAADGLLDVAALSAGRAALTLQGRLLADLVIRDLAA